MASLVRVVAATALLSVFLPGTPVRAAPRLATGPACQMPFPDPRKPGHSISVVWGPGSPGKALTYRDPETQILFYGESDGRHLAAIGTNGKLLWVRNPFDDQGLCPYRNARPVLVEIKAANPLEIKAYLNNPRAGLNKRDRYIGITFDSSQFGLVNQRTGAFFFEGQN